MLDILPQIGSLITLIFGIWALTLPLKFSRFVYLTPYKNFGKTEIRATYGGLIMALALFALYSQNDIVFQGLACAWFGAALGRSIGILADKSYTPKMLQFVIGEIIIGLLFIF
ncbi:MAG: DUF4345 family protein [Chitinophagales bacterium]